MGRLTGGGVNRVRDEGIRLDGGAVGQSELLGVLETGREGQELIVRLKVVS